MALRSVTDWVGVFKPLLLSKPDEIRPVDVLSIAKAISKNKNEFLHCKTVFCPYFGSLGVLFVNGLSHNNPSEGVTAISPLASACGTVAECLLKTLSALEDGKEGDFTASPLTPDLVFRTLHSLCNGTPCLTEEEQTKLLNYVQDKDFFGTYTLEEGKTASDKDQRKQRVDLSSNLLEKLTSVIPGDFGPSSKSTVEETEDKNNSLKLLWQKNIVTLLSLKAGDVSLTYLHALPRLKTFVLKWQDADKNVAVTLSATEASAFRLDESSLAKEMDLALQALTLPVFEPLVPDKLERIVDIVMASLYAAVTVATVHAVSTIGNAPQTKATPMGTNKASLTLPPNKEDDWDQTGNRIVEKAIELYNSLGEMLRKSSRAGPQVYQNYQMFGAWLILTGLQNQFATLSQSSQSGDKMKEDKGKSPCKVKEVGRINLTKVQQGFGVLSVALATHGLELVEELVNLTGFDGNGSALPLQILAQGNSTQRVQTLLQSVPFTSLLYYLATVAYRKACNLKRIQKNYTDGDTFSLSDSATYYEDDFSCSEGSCHEEDEDSEPILGHWFEETLTPPDPQPAKSRDANAALPQRAPAKPSSSHVVPDKGEPHGFIILATRVFNLMNKWLLIGSDSVIQQYLTSSLTEQQMALLAAIVKDLDRETARTDTGTISQYFGVALGKLYSDFSLSLSVYTHNLLVKPAPSLSASLQQALLSFLGISPYGASEEPWPLHVCPRSLTILAQVVLGSVISSKEEAKRVSEAACVNVWMRMLNTLATHIRTPGIGDQDCDDLNVEHAQLLLFMFHTLQLMQKKALLLHCAQVLQEVIPIVVNPIETSQPQEMQYLLMARLLLLFEYIVKYLYDPPSFLLEQVQWNLLSLVGLKDNSASSEMAFNTATRIYNGYDELEEAYKKLASGAADEWGMRPKFYILASTDTASPSEIPKLDGLACSFLLGTSDTFQYGKLYERIVSVLSVIKQPGLHNPNQGTTLCAIQYCFTITWRLIQSLPPAVSAIEQLPRLNDPDTTQMLLCILWGPRLVNEAFGMWIRDCLVRQGLTTTLADVSVRNAAEHVNNKTYMLSLIQRMANVYSSRDEARVLPAFTDVVLLDLVVARLHIMFDECTLKETEQDSYRVLDSPTEKTSPTSKFSKDIFATVCNLVETVANACRLCVLKEANEEADVGSGSGHLLSISSRRGCKLAQMGQNVAASMPSSIKAALEVWNASISVEFPASQAWRCGSNGNLLLSEHYLTSLVASHVALLSAQTKFSVAPSLRHLLTALVRLVNDIVLFFPSVEDGEKELVHVFSPLILDACFEHVVDFVQLVLERVIGAPESEHYQGIAYYHYLRHIHALLTLPDSKLEEKLLEECIGVMDSALQSGASRLALSRFYTEKDDAEKNYVRLLDILWAASRVLSSSTQYVPAMNKFFHKLLKNGTESNDSELKALCNTLLEVNNDDKRSWKTWLKTLLTTEEESQQPKAKETTDKELSIGKLQVLQSLANYATLKSSVAERFARTLLDALLECANAAAQAQPPVLMSSSLVKVSIQLASIAQGSGHLLLFSAALQWIQACRKHMASSKETGKEKKMDLPLSSLCITLQYVADVLAALKLVSTTSSSNQAVTALGVPFEMSSGDTAALPIPAASADDEWLEELGVEDMESEGEDSDEDSLGSKLCTFTITQREFMNQHWYHCHTCGMNDGVGVCTVCAKVCHKGHDLSYAKFGSFFCDCGAKEDGTCEALVRRFQSEELTTAPATSGTGPSTLSSAASRLIRPLLPDTPDSSNANTFQRTESTSDVTRGNTTEDGIHRLAASLDSVKEGLINEIQSNWSHDVIQLLNLLLPRVEAHCRVSSAVGSLQRAKKALQDLHGEPAAFDLVDNLLIPTLGSQEGAFENVKMNFSGDQGQTIRQLLSAHMIRRVSMVIMATPNGKRQHLAMSHEKGKITILQLGTLLKQADASKRKLTLTRLASAPVPFTVLSMASNPANEDVLAVCGLKECHVLTFHGSGSVADHIALHPQLETGNFLIKAIWLPASATEVALVTADFVKIYDLGTDALSPQFYFLLPNGKIRDVTFFCLPHGPRYVIIMASSGYVYWQALSEESAAQHGPFYVTNVLDIAHPDLKEQNWQLGGGGVSVYCSHALQMLCFSYTQGKSFVAALREEAAQQKLELGPVLHKISARNPSGASSGVKLGSSSVSSHFLQQPLCQWAEVANHPGLVYALTQTSNTPVVLMLEPGKVTIQEIKAAPSKVKVTDLVALRHFSTTSVATKRDNTSVEYRTTLVVLCDDGSLRIFAAAPETTSYWVAPSLQPPVAPPPVKPARKDKSSKVQLTGSQTAFSVDFFESCQPINDIEFGGNDLLHVYNPAQLKHRLNTTGLYIASSKPTGFTLETTNQDSANMVMTGMRILVGTQDVQRAPSYVKLFGRTISLGLVRHRWFDLPLTREESLQADKKLLITFGPSLDPADITMVDSVKIYGKTKEAFNWPEDVDEVPLPQSNSALGGAQPAASVAAPAYGTLDERALSGALSHFSPPKPSKLENFLAEALSAIENYLAFASKPENLPAPSTNAVSKEEILKLTTVLLTLHWTGRSTVPARAKAVMAALHPTPAAYHDYKDPILLHHILDELEEIQNTQSAIYLDPEAFYHLLGVARAIASSRPENLVKFTFNDEEPTFMIHLLATAQKLHSHRVRSSALSPAGQSGLTQIDITVQSLVDIFHAFAVTQERFVEPVIQNYITLLLCEDGQVSHAVKNALLRIFKSTRSLGSNTSSKAAATADRPHELTPADISHQEALPGLRLALLQKLTAHLPELKHKKRGLQAIPFLQTFVMLLTDLNASQARSRAVLEQALKVAVIELQLSRTADVEVAGERTAQHEVQLLIMKLFALLLSHKTKGSSRSSQYPVCSVAAEILVNAGLVQRCLNLLQAILRHWKSLSSEEADATVVGALLQPTSPWACQDLSPFFPSSTPSPTLHAQSMTTDVFHGFSQMLTEIALRLPYLVKKVQPQIQLDREWVDCMCEYLTTAAPSAVKRHVRKLLLFHCGTKEAYRQARDLHTLQSRLTQIREIVSDELDTQLDNLVLPYDHLVQLMEHLKTCLDVASVRTSNWQTACLQESSTLAFLLRLGCVVDEGVCGTVLQLLRFALCPLKPVPTQAPPIPARKDKTESKSEELAWDLELSCPPNCLCGQFTQKLVRTVQEVFLRKFLSRFLLDSNSTAVRWQAHALWHSVYKHSTPEDQKGLVDLLWSLWSGLPSYGRKAAQFVDLLGFFTIQTPNLDSGSLNHYVDLALKLLQEENGVLLSHPNAVLYNALTGLVNLEGFFLERDPCLVCSNPEIPFTTVKLSALKADSKFTTTTQIIKLTGSHTISRLALRMTDIKRSKMVRTINIYYNNRPVQAAIELKSKVLWHKAKKIGLSAGQSEVKVDLALPITACNLKMEFATFYENLHGSSEMLQCPRCSASVPAHPGVCSNCGENVYQCHKCRAINYDEKDPFLCNACGFCKYAKFDWSLTARPCGAVDPVESDEDRKKALQNINSMMEKAERVQQRLAGLKESLEGCLQNINDPPNEDTTNAMSPSVSAASSAGGANNNVAPPTSTGSLVNRALQQIAQKYSLECKAAFEELSTIAQRVAACRRELVTYDVSLRKKSARVVLHSGSNQCAKTAGHCYGCVSAALEHCLTLLRAMATQPSLRQLMFEQGLLQELLQHNVSQGSAQSRAQVRDLLCLLTNASPEAVDALNRRLIDSVESVLSRMASGLQTWEAVRYDIQLLAASLQCQDSCWEQRLRCAVLIFLKSTQFLASPYALEIIALPCLRMIQNLVEGSTATIPASVTISSNAEMRLQKAQVGVNLQRWLHGDPQHSFATWKPAQPLRQTPIPTQFLKEPAQIRAFYLMQKYAARWRLFVYREKRDTFRLTAPDPWLQRMLFSSSSRFSRQTACVFLEGLSRVPERHQQVVDLLTNFLAKLGAAGYCGTEYVQLYQNLIRAERCKYYLVCQGLLPKLSTWIGEEISQLSALEKGSLNHQRFSELSQGFALKALTEILAFFMADPAIRQQYKSRLVSHVLNGYLNLKRLVIQRTRFVDETQEMLLNLLGDMTSGTEEEAKQFMAVCIQTIRDCQPDDLLTPIFVLERLCDLIHAEEKDDAEFFLSLDKDPQQEDYLQGRMQGNPYSSSEPGLGPLMRDVKNKICADCELIALLEDDTGMELLVCNKIMSLDLPVREVYKKVWLAENSEQEAMRVIYRMRGLLGDATEEFVERLDGKQQGPVDEEEMYRVGAVMAENEGLQVILDRLACVEGLEDEGKPLMASLVKLLHFCVKLRVNRQQLIQPAMQSAATLLRAFQQCLAVGGQPPNFTEQLLEVLETILREASNTLPLDKYREFSEPCGSGGSLEKLLKYAQDMSENKACSFLTRLMRVIPFLTLANNEKMDLLIQFYQDALYFTKYDWSHTPALTAKLESFCSLTAGIERNAVGNTLKDRMVASGVVKQALEYLQTHAPPMKSTVARETEEWTKFISRPSLTIILRLLTGLAHEHATTQLAVAEQSIPLIHRLEQVSSDEHVGTLAENLLEAIKGHPECAAQVEKVRQETRAEKKRLAMAMREKQLGQLGMRANAMGQVKAENPMLQQLVDLGLGEETGLVCVICREGYRFQPTRVLAIYTFSKRCQLEDLEHALWNPPGQAGGGPLTLRARKMPGYYSVSHFNVVHVECHLAAVRLARARDEWESAALQNASTRCNGLLPLWGPHVPEPAFASCLARHNTYLQECTGHRDIGYVSTIHDTKLLLLRFALERSFSDESGGGGPESNLHFLPYQFHVALYVFNTTRAWTREEKSLTAFLNASRSEWASDAVWEVDNAFYWTVVAVLVQSGVKWKATRTTFLARLLALAHQRSQKGKTVADYAIYKPALVFFALINGLYEVVFKSVVAQNETDWPIALADYIRHNDEAMQRSIDKLLEAYQSDFLTAASFSEFCDVVGLLEDVPTPDAFLEDLVLGLP